jgi:Family of unknown function (DUF6247)
VTAGAHAEQPSWPARTPVGVRAALRGRDREQFERDYQAALDRAAADFDLTPVLGLVERWWRIAVLSQDSTAHRRMLAAVDALRAGEPAASTPRSELGL